MDLRASAICRCDVKGCNQGGRMILTIQAVNVDRIETWNASLHLCPSHYNQIIESILLIINTITAKLSVKIIDQDFFNEPIPFTPIKIAGEHQKGSGY